MIDLDRAFRDTEQMPVADLWPDIVTRTPGTPPSRSPRPRAAAIVVAVVVAVLGIGLLMRAFSEGSTQPAVRTTNPSVSHAPDRAAVISPGLRCRVSYSFWHTSAVHDYYKYRVRVENDRNRGKWIDVGINLVGATDVHPHGVRRFRVYVPARSVKTVTNWFKVLRLKNVKLDYCTTTS